MRTLSVAVAEQGAALDSMVGFIGRNFENLAQQKPALFQRAHQDVGVQAMRNVSQAFISRRFRRPVGPYRGSENRLSGRLGRALSSSANIHATVEGLSIINSSYLDREAAHWRRLNFGAGAGSREGIIAPQQFPITWGGVAAGVLGLASDPSPAFVIPFGFWLNSGGPTSPSVEALGQDRFFPGSASRRLGGFGGAHGAGSVKDLGFVQQRRKATGGIASRNFLDAGVRGVANDLPRAYQTIYEDVYADTKTGLAALARNPISTQYRRPNRGAG